MAKKMYSAFISSVYESLKDKRMEAIDCLLDSFIFPICMEHFTTASNKNLEALQRKIDDADFVILLLGKEYGSTDEQGVSWTEREYLYCCQKNIDLVAIKLRELQENMDLTPQAAALLPESQRKQVAFASRVSSAVKEGEGSTVKDIINRYLSGADHDSFAGWERGVSARAEARALAEFESSHRPFDLSGIWHHVHFSDDDERYLRIGTVSIEQSFTPSGYHRLRLRADNYNAGLSEGRIVEDFSARSRWEGDYTLSDSGSLEGIYTSFRSFKGSYNGDNVPAGGTRGVHLLSVIRDESSDVRISGTFEDCAPYMKKGNVLFFRDRDKRDAYIMANRASAFEKDR